MDAAPRIVQDVETLKALADPARLNILELLMSDRERTWTAKQLATTIHMPLKKIYYHLGLLEQRELLHVRDTAVINGIIEKHYAASQASITFQRGAGGPVDVGLPAAGHEDMGLVVDTLFHEARSNILTGLRTGKAVMHREAPEAQRVVVSYSTAAMPPARVGQFRQALLGVVEEFQATDVPGEPRFELLIAIGPRSED